MCWLYCPRPSLLDAARASAPRVNPHLAPRPPGSLSLEAVSSRARDHSCGFLPRTARHKQPRPSGAGAGSAHGFPLPSPLRTNGSASQKARDLGGRVGQEAVAGWAQLSHGRVKLGVAACVMDVDDRQDRRENESSNVQGEGLQLRCWAWQPRSSMTGRLTPGRVEAASVSCITSRRTPKLLLAKTC